MGLDVLGLALFRPQVERPAIEGRLLYWLAALHAVDGMLYYEVDRWANEPCPSGACKTIGRINNTALTDFSPATFHSANGDGSFTYPGPEGPVGTIRLANIADGIEVNSQLRVLR